MDHSIAFLSKVNIAKFGSRIGKDSLLFKWLLNELVGLCLGIMILKINDAIWEKPNLERYTGAGRHRREETRAPAHSL